jgi:prepilin-type processing-associated H-X9-DG protein
VVHGDYHQRNLLLVDGHVSAVFDWEGAHTGDSRFDGFVMAYWSRAVPEFASPDVADHVWKRVTADLEPEALAVYAGHMALRNLEFYARVHPDAIPWCVNTIEEILAPCWRRQL